MHLRSLNNTLRSLSNTRGRKKPRIKCNSILNRKRGEVHYFVSPNSVHHLRVFILLKWLTGLCFSSTHPFTVAFWFADHPPKSPKSNPIWGPVWEVTTSEMGANIPLLLNWRLQLPADTNIKAINRNRPVRIIDGIIDFSQCITKKE